MDIEYFHGASDKWPIRNAVFELIAHKLDAIHIDCRVVEKRKARPGLREGNTLRVYEWMLGYFMRHLVDEEKKSWHAKADCHD